MQPSSQASFALLPTWLVTDAVETRSASSLVRVMAITAKGLSSSLSRALACVRTCCWVSSLLAKDNTPTLKPLCWAYLRRAKLLPGTPDSKHRVLCQSKNRRATTSIAAPRRETSPLPRAGARLGHARLVEASAVLCLKVCYKLGTAQKDTLSALCSKQFLSL